MMSNHDIKGITAGLLEPASEHSHEHNLKHEKQSEIADLIRDGPLWLKVFFALGLLGKEYILVLRPVLVFVLIGLATKGWLIEAMLRVLNTRGH